MKLFLVMGGPSMVLGARWFVNRNLLFSYASIRRGPVGPKARIMKSSWLNFISQVRRQGCVLMLDSGAFSADRQGVPVKVEDYASFLETYGHLFELAVNLDVIGERQVAKDTAGRSFQNYMVLKDKHPCLVPVIHAGEPFELIDDYLREGAPVIGIGALVSKGVNEAIKALIPYANKGVRMHAMGRTAPEVLRKVPLYSADSQNWSLGSIHGYQIISEFGQAARLEFRWKPRTRKRHSKASKTMERARFASVSNPRLLLIQALDLTLETERFFTEYWRKRGVEWEDPWNERRKDGGQK